MKVLGILLLFGLAAIATSLQGRWERERDEIVSLFMKGMDEAGPLRIAMGMPDAYELDEEEEEVKKNLGDLLRERMNEFLDKIKDAIEKGKDLKKEYFDKIKEIQEKLKDLKEDLKDKLKEKARKVRDKVKEFFEKLLEGKDSKEERALSEAIESAENGFNLKEIMDHIREMLRKHIDTDKIKEYIEKFKNTEIGQILLEKFEKLKESDLLNKLRDFIRKILGKDRETRSLKEFWERVKDFFKEKHIQFKEKYLEFAEWLKEAIRKGLDVAKDKITSLKNIAKEIIDHSKEVSKEVALEALDALKPYKEDLGDLWNQLKDTVNEIVHRKD